HHDDPHSGDRGADGGSHRSHLGRSPHRGRNPRRVPRPPRQGARQPRRNVPGDRRMSTGVGTPGSLLWFAHFEARLAWRDALSMMTAGRLGRQRKLALGLVTFLLFLHLVAYLVLRFVEGAVRPDLPTFVLVTAGLAISGSAMLAQAMETVTRTFYTRSDLELILSAPVEPSGLFAVRIAAMALSASGMSILVMGPFINVLAWRSGIQWLGGYGVLVAVAIASTGVAVALTMLLFKLLGPAR